MTRDERDIKYVNREFTDFKQQLTEFAKNYFPDSYNDFSPTSPGTMFIEMASYVGDVLSFYQDTQLQETYLQYTKDPANLYSLAYMMGYKPKISHVSEVDLQVTQIVGAKNGKPDYDFAAIIPEDTVIRSNSTNNIPFLIDQKIDFTYSSSLDPTSVTVATLEEGEPVEFLLTKQTKAFSSEIVTTTRNFGNAEKFTTITIDDENIIGVLDITDNSSTNENQWYEVPFLGQDTIFDEQENTDSDRNNTPYIMNLKRVPKRFVTRFNSQGELQIQFGAGTTGQSDETFTPDPTNIGMGTNQGVSKLDVSYDPSNFLYTNTYGLAPSNTTLTIRYLKGGGIESNVPANTLTQFSLNNTVSKDPTKTEYLDSITFNNPEPARGGKDGDTVEELRQNALRSFAEQGRAITLQDYTVRALSLPPKFGSIAKVYVSQDSIETRGSLTDVIIDNNPLALSMYILGYDNDSKLVNANQKLKQNLKTYLSQYIPITDAINIKDAFIVNFGIDYEIIIRPGFSTRDVLIKCTQELIDFFEIRKWSINQPINLSTIYSLLDRVKGVQTVQEVKVENKVNGSYSEFAYDMQGATRNNIVYPSYDPMIFELKFPQQDIKGRTTTL